MILVVLLPILILFVVLAATTGLALRSRSRSVVVRESLPVAQRWVELDVQPEREAVEFLEESPPQVATLTQNPQGSDLSLNDLMYYKLNIYYGAANTKSLNDLLARFRAENP